MTVTINGTSGVTTPGVTNSEGYSGDGLTIAAGAPATAVQVDTAGNVGVGVTPSAWSSPFTKALDIGASGAVATTGTSIRVTNNASYNSGWLYKYTGAAAHYDLTAGAHEWYIAPSGTAGNPITFTQAMTLDASGNLLVGATSAFNYGNGVQLYPTSNGGGISIGHPSGTVSGSGYMLFGYNNLPIGSIAQNGTTAVAYNTTSDHRLKTNVRPADANRFNDTQFRDFEWVDGRHDCGVIAHELQAVYPDLVLGEKDAVDADGNPVYQQVNYTGLIARMGTVVQKQQVLIEQLTARIEALEAK